MTGGRGSCRAEARKNGSVREKRLGRSLALPSIKRLRKHPGPCVTVLYRARLFGMGFVFAAVTAAYLHRPEAKATYPRAQSLTDLLHENENVSVAKIA